MEKSSLDRSDPENISFGSSVYFSGSEKDSGVKVNGFFITPPLLSLD
jgi:hypothetical protein